MSKAREYEQYAAECLRQADRQPKDREHWMTLAAHWSALAAKAAIEEQTIKSMPEQDSDSSTPAPK